VTTTYDAKLVARLADVRAKREDRQAEQQLGARITRMSTVKPERVRWLWPGHLPRGKVVDLSGDPGVGKSTLALDIAARVSTGRAMPDGAGGGRPRGVLILSAEDGLADTIRPRLEAAGADLDRVIALTAVTDRGPTSPALVHQAHETIHEADEKGLTRKGINIAVGGKLTSPELDDLLASVPGLEVMRRLEDGRSVNYYVTNVEPNGLDAGAGDRPVTLPQDLPTIEAIVKQYNVALVVIDVLMAYLDSKVNSYKDQDIRRLVMSRLAPMAERTGACVVFLRHLNKSGGSNPMYRSGGSIGIIGAVRAGFIVGVDPDDENLRVLACSKMNLAIEPPSLKYTLVSDERFGAARVEWQGASPHRAKDILGAEEDSEERSERDEAADWLRAYLADERRGGEATFSEIRKAARADGLAERTLQRARARAGVVTVRTGFPSRTVWRFAVEPQSRQSCQGSDTGATGATGATGQPTQLPSVTDEELPL